MTEFPFVDPTDGTYWYDQITFRQPDGPCFMCGQPTDRVNVCFEAHFCDSAECNGKIAADLAALMDGSP